MNKEEIKNKLRDIFGEENVSQEKLDLISSSRDLWTKTTLNLRKGVISNLPDFVVWPENKEQISSLLKFADKEKIPVTPFGGGSGVCGGTSAIKGGIILDLKKMNRILKIFDKSLIVESESGIIGEILERKLNNSGYTLGHYPQSIYCSTLGGWIATRSAGQLSTKYGKIEDMVLNMEVVLPNGEIIETKSFSHSATGPDFNQIFIGSEGTLGIITKARLKIHTLPEVRLFRGVEFPDLSKGLESIRKILREGIKPACIRLYDELDTFVFKLGGKDKEGEDTSIKARLKPIFKFAKEKLEEGVFLIPTIANKITSIVKGKCLLILVFDGKKEIAELEEKISLQICKELNGEDLGEEIGKRWWKKRFDVAYNLSKVFFAGSFADTIEVAISWDKVEELYREIRKELSPHCFIMAHFSHAYLEGCSIYFSFLARQEKEEKLYDKIWEISMTIVNKMGGTISHHHGVGLLKAKFMEKEWGQETIKIYQELKNFLDPNNILNPGKMGLK